MKQPPPPPPPPLPKPKSNEALDGQKQPPKPNLAPVAHSKEAATCLGCVMATVQVPVPLHPSPLQPEKVELLAGAAERVTLVPAVNAALQMEPQLIPAGLVVTVPSPRPPIPTVSVKVWSGALLITPAMNWDPLLSRPTPVAAPLSASSLNSVRV